MSNLNLKKDGSALGLEVGDTEVISSMRVLTNITGSIEMFDAGTLPVARGGTGLAALGSAGQVMAVDSAETALEFADVFQSANEDAAATVVLGARVTDDAHDRVQILTDSIKLGDGTAAPQADLSYSGGRVVLDKDLAVPTLVRPTDDGSDNDFLGLSGGGVVGSSRGAFVLLYGNEHANAGRLRLGAGEAGFIALETAGAEQARVTDRLLVGTTSDGNTTAGGGRFAGAFQADAEVYFTGKLEISSGGALGTVDPGTAATLVFTAASTSIAGISGGAEGRRISLVTRHLSQLIILHESAVIADNHISVPGGDDATLPIGAGCDLIYENSRWRALSTLSVTPS